MDKSIVQQNGIQEGSTSSAQSISLLTNSTSTASIRLKFDMPGASESKNLKLAKSAEQKLFNPSSTVPATSAYLVNGIVSSEAHNSAASTSLSQTSTLPVQFQTAYDKSVVKKMEKKSSVAETPPPCVINSEDKSVSLSRPSGTNYSSPENISHSSSSSSSLSRHCVLVNSVYSGVNNFIGSSSEASCVVTKSIMEADGPATVCVDLNAHDMEPSSLSAEKAIVDLNKEIFHLEGERRLPEIPNDCQVNSSEDVSRGVGQSSSSCDNSGVDAPPTVVNGSVEEGHSHSVSNVNRDFPETMEVVGSSQQAAERNQEEVVMSVSERPGPSSCPSESVMPNVISETNTISSSGGNDSSVDVEVKHSSHSGNEAECDSMEGVVEQQPNVCDSGTVNSAEAEVESVGVVAPGSGPHNSANNDNEEREDGGQSACDSANSGVSSAPRSQLDDGPMDIEDGAVSESCIIDRSHAVGTRRIDNVDSTSFQQTTNSASASTSNSSPGMGNSGNGSLCDSSNSDRGEALLNSREISNADDSSTEEVGVSSSSTMRHLSLSANARTSTWEITQEAFPDNAVSAVSSQSSGDLSPTADVTSGPSTSWEDHSSSSHPGASHEAVPSSQSSLTSSSSSSSSSSPRIESSSVVSSNTLSTASTLQPLRPLLHLQTSASSAAPEEPGESGSVSSGVTSSAPDQAANSLSPTLPSSSAANSTSEAMPSSAKKKVRIDSHRL